VAGEVTGLLIEIFATVGGVIVIFKALRNQQLYSRKIRAGEFTRKREIFLSLLNTFVSSLLGVVLIFYFGLLARYV